MSTFYPTILKWNTATVANGETMSTSLNQLESNDNYLLALINELSTDDGTISYVNVVNNTASIISKGQPVYVNGVVGDKLGVALADNTNQTKSTVIGLAIADIAASAEGNIMLSGVVSNLDTHTFTAGTKIYLGASAGSFTTTEPIAPVFSVLIGNVINSDSTVGKIFVNISTSSKDYKVKYHADDTTPQYAGDKLNSDGITITRTNINNGGILSGLFSSTGVIKVDVDDNDKSSWSHLSGCLDEGTNITYEIVEVNGKRKIRINSTASSTGDIEGSGTATHIAKFTGEKTIADSRMTEDANSNLSCGSNNNLAGSNSLIMGSLNNTASTQTGGIIIGNTNTDEGTNNNTIGKDNNISGTATDRITIGRGNTNVGENDIVLGINILANSADGDKVFVGKNITMDETIDADVHLGGGVVQLHGTMIDKSGNTSDSNKIVGFDVNGEFALVENESNFWKRNVDTISPIDEDDALNVASVDYKIPSQYPIPADAEGRTKYNPNTNSLVFNPDDNNSIELGRELFVRAINNTGSTIAKNSVVRLNNNDANEYPTIELANVVSLDKCHNIGITTAESLTGSEVEVQTYGLMKGVNTSAFEITDLIYLDETGTLVKVAPVAPYIPMIVYTVLKKDSVDGWVFINSRIGYNTSSGTSYAFQAKGAWAGFDTIVNDAIYTQYTSNNVNVGDAFDSLTGKFTIATAGIYTFTASALFNEDNVETDTSNYLYIKRFNSLGEEQESSMAFQTIDANGDSSTSTGVTAIFDCAEGDYVALTFHMSTTTLQVNKVHFTGFSLTGLKGDQGPIGLTGPSGVTNISEADDALVTNIQTGNVLNWSGTKWVNTDALSLDAIQLDTEAAEGTMEGKLFWDATDKTLAVGLAGGSTLQVGQEFLVRAVNKTGAPITNGQVVYISGSQGSRVVISLAQSILTESPQTSLAVATQTIANNAEGFFTSQGLVRGIDTSAFTEGDIIYVSTTAGGITNVAPAKPYSQLVVGIVTIARVNGAIYVDPYPIARISQLTDVSIVSPTTGDVLMYNATTGRWYNGTGGGGGSGDTYMVKLTDGDTTPGFLLDKLTVAPGSPITLSETGVLDILEEDVSDPLIKTVSLLSESGVNNVTGSCWSSVFEDGEWGNGYGQNTTDSYYRLIPDARGTVSKVTFYVANINGEDGYYGGYAGAIRIGLFDAAGTLKGSTAWTRNITTLGTHTLSMTAEAGQTLTIDRNTTYWIGVIGRGIDLIAYKKITSGLNLTNLRYSVRIRSGSNGAMWSDFLTSGTGYADNAICVVQMSAT